MSEWRQRAIGELGTVVTGSTPSKEHADWFGNEVNFITPTDLSTDGRRPSPARGLSTTGVENLRRRLLPPGTVCFTCIASIGKMCLTAAPAVTNQQINSIVVDSDVADARFVYYLLRNEAARIGTFASGAATPIINKTTFSAIEVGLPPLSTQEAIAEILGSLDDLIENNRRRIEVLEEMAQAIYREWFVHFRFPGHENATFLDSPLGPIPEGWSVEPLSDLGTLIRGRSYRKHELVEEGGLPFVNLKCAMRGGGFRLDGLKRYSGEFKPEQLVGHGDIILAVTDLTQGREILAQATLVPRLAEGQGVISLDIARIIPNSPIDRLPLYFALRCGGFADRVKEYANGATVLHLSPKHVEAGQLVWPEKALRERFNSSVEPMISYLDELRESAERLGDMRDLLLPKLVSGEIDVSDLDLDVVLEGVG